MDSCSTASSCTWLVLADGPHLVDLGTFTCSWSTNIWLICSCINLGMLFTPYGMTPRDNASSGTFLRDGTWIYVFEISVVLSGGYFDSLSTRFVVVSPAVTLEGIWLVVERSLASDWLFFSTDIPVENSSVLDLLFSWTCSSSSPLVMASSARVFSCSCLSNSSSFLRAVVCLFR